MKNCKKHANIERIFAFAIIYIWNITLRLGNNRYKRTEESLSITKLKWKDYYGRKDLKMIL